MYSKKRNDATTKIFNNMSVDYNVVKDEYNLIINEDNTDDTNSNENDNDNLKKEAKVSRCTFKR